MISDYAEIADYLMSRSYMYRRLGFPYQSYKLRRMAWQRREAADV